MDLREEVEKYKCSFKRRSIQAATTVATLHQPWLRNSSVMNRHQDRNHQIDTNCELTYICSLHTYGGRDEAEKNEMVERKRKKNTWQWNCVRDIAWKVMIFIIHQVAEQFSSVRLIFFFSFLQLSCKLPWNECYHIVLVCIELHQARYMWKSCCALNIFKGGKNHVNSFNYSNAIRKMPKRGGDARKAKMMSINSWHFYRLTVMNSPRQMRFSRNHEKRFAEIDIMKRLISPCGPTKWNANANFCWTNMNISFLCLFSCHRKRTKNCLFSQRPFLRRAAKNYDF